MTIHYEVLLLYACGLSPKDIIKLGYSRGCVYRFRRIYRDAGKRLASRLAYRNLVSPRGENRVNNLGELRNVKRKSSGGKRPKSCRGCAQIWGSVACDTCPEITGVLE